MVDPIYTDALIYASLLAMLAIGLTLTYITTRVPNFAHASVAMVGAYIALIITRVVDVNPYISIPISFVVAGMVSLGLYMFVLKPLIRRNASKAIQMISNDIGIEMYGLTSTTLVIISAMYAPTIATEACAKFGTLVVM